jgi:hypothetical protein
MEERMKDVSCPLCHDENIKFVTHVHIEGTEDTRPLYMCLNYKDFFWGDSGEKAQRLSEFCKTRFFEPDKCDEDKFVFFPQHQYGDSTLSEIKELDIICFACENKRFVLRRKK